MLQISQNFSMPLAMARLKGVEQLNTDLLRYFKQLSEDGGYRNDLPTQPERDTLYESKFDLFEHDNKAVQALKNLMHSELTKLVMKLNQYPEAVRETLKIEQHAWFHITKKHGYFTYHNHPMASWSGIYCPEGGGRPQNEPESAITRFAHPVPSANYYMDAGNANLQPPFSIAPFNLLLEAGDLVFFPSHLMHEVTPHLGERDRVTIAVNFWISSPLVQVRI